MMLNNAQRAASESKAPLRIIIAGPGSGKTRTMVDAVKRTEVGSRIAVMTFTNAGANEFRARLRTEPDGAGGFTDTDHLANRQLDYCGTLHGYCMRLVQKFGGLLGYVPGKVGILPETERMTRLLECRDKLGLKVSARAIEKKASNEASRVNLSEENEINLVVQEYEFLLKRNNLVDYDGLLEVAHQLILTLTRSLYGRSGDCALPILDHLFVDEYQDSGALDHLIYDAIPARKKMYVGDPDQSIFGFRGAYPAGMVCRVVNVIEGEMKGEVHKLELNYRSGRAICDTANRLIGFNKDRVEKIIMPVSNEGSEVAVSCFETAAEEYGTIAAKCANLKSDISVAILCRMNREVRECRAFLGSMGIPVAGPKFEQRPADWEGALLLLALTLSPENEILAERYLLLSHDKATVNRWKLESQAAGLLLSSQIKHQGHAGDVLRLLRVNGVSESTVMAIEARMAQLPPDSNLSDLLHHLRSNEEPKEQGASYEAGSVYVGTIHSAKGREFDVVFLPAFDQGLIPHQRAPLEEERRLAFVAVTRARRAVYISYCKRREFAWGGVRECEPSQFLKEML